MALMALLVGLFASHFELNERLYDHTRQWEHFQVDEWPMVALALAIGFAWFAWRRYRFASAVLAANRQLAQQSLELQESTQKHLARELHDELGQYLNAIKLDAHAILESPPAGGPAATRVVSAADHMQGVLGDILRRLRPAGLDELGLAAALESCVNHWRLRMPDAVIQLTLSDELDSLNEPEALTVYRVVQEALTNASRHANASRIEVSLACEPAVGGRRHLRLAVSDNGRGAPDEASTPGFGLSAMRERVELLGGTLRVTTAPQAGFTLAVELPVAVAW